jgi:ribosome-associated protein
MLFIIVLWSPRFIAAHDTMPQSICVALCFLFMPESKPSKSARKREYQALQSLGEQLIDLNAEQLAGMALDEQLLEAVQTARSMKAHGALRRQKQLIGKLMRDVDPEPIRLALDAFNRHDNLAKEIFRETERWRDRIVTEGAVAVEDFFALIGGENRTLREQAIAYEVASHDKARKLLRRRIFSEIHQELAMKMQNTSR